MHYINVNVKLVSEASYSATIIKLIGRCVTEMHVVEECKLASESLSGQRQSDSLY